MSNFISVSQGSLVRGPKKNMEVAESAAGLLIYKELDYSCIHGGKILVPFPTVNA